MIRILCVCLGNICRSPLAEGILRRQAHENGLEILVDSAGIGDWHVGQPPDPRAIQIGISSGCEMTMSARQVQGSDFKKFDMILAMDHSNLQALNQWPDSDPTRIKLIRSFDPTAKDLEVPDPYYGEYSDFESVAEMLENACQGIIRSIKESNLS